MRDLPPANTFSTAAATLAGWTPSALQHAVRRGRLVRPRRGWYARSDADPELIRVRAASAAYPSGVISHRSAARLHGLPLIGAPAPLPEMTFGPRTSGNRHGVKHYRATARPEDVTELDGALVTSVARTVVDVGRHAPIGTSVVLLDAALHGARTDLDAIADVLRHCWNWPGIKRAQRAARFSDARSESPLESVSRLVMRWLRIPTPDLQTRIFDRYGRLIGRSDFYWDEFGVIGEADGRSKYSDRAVLIAEKQRQEALEDLGLVVTRWQWEVPTRRPRAFRDQLERAFERGRARKRSGLPTLWTL